jgi:hypothetical protein
MSIQVEDLKRVAHKVLDILGVIDYSELQLTYALKTTGKWKVSFEYEPYRPIFSSGDIRKTGSFVVDAKSEEIEAIWLDRAWK